MSDDKSDLIQIFTEDLQKIFGEKERKLEDLVTIYLGNDNYLVDFHIHT